VHPHGLLPSECQPLFPSIKANVISLFVCTALICTTLLLPLLLRMELDELLSSLFRASGNHELSFPFLLSFRFAYLFLLLRADQLPFFPHPSQNSGEVFLNWFPGPAGLFFPLSKKLNWEPSFSLWDFFLSPP